MEESRVGISSGRAGIGWGGRGLTDGGGCEVRAKKTGAARAATPIILVARSIQNIL